jgi:hypothetical protein
VRLCAAVPPPWFNMVRYFGVLSSHSRERPEVCPQAPPAPGRFKPEPAAGDQLSLEGLFAVGQETKELHSGRSRWSWLSSASSAQTSKRAASAEAPCVGLRSPRSEAPSPDCSPSMGSGHSPLPHSGPTYRGRSSRCRSIAERRRPALGASSGPGHTEPARTCVREQVKRPLRPWLLLHTSAKGHHRELAVVWPSRATPRCSRNVPKPRRTQPEGALGGFLPGGGAFSRSGIALSAPVSTAAVKSVRSGSCADRSRETSILQRERRLPISPTVQRLGFSMIPAALARRYG